MKRMKKNTPRIAVMSVLLIGLGIVLAGCKFAETPGAVTDHNKASTSTNKPAAAHPADGNAEPAQGEIQIVIQDFAFKPADVTVAPGTKVTWVNKDDAPHTATSVDKKFNSGGLDTDDKFSFVFTDKGEYQYICTLHPQMKATIKVK
jgi:plastocyanin